MIEPATRKRLGQYFSGYKVADLLIELCAPTEDELVIDPMAGTGDMLMAAIRRGVLAENTSGIEIEPYVGDLCRRNIPSGNIYIGDAFSLDPYLAFRRSAWDLVVTNPPYVRYQSLGDYKIDGLRLKNAKETRRSLGEIVRGLTHLNDDEKTCFRRIIQNYSGLSDLAVPSWILCAALTQVGGRLAMVVPESWMSRDYAVAIKYMLLKFFHLEYIVEDLDSVWFPDAMVKTNLLVANRVQFRESIDEVGDSMYKYIRLGAGLAGEDSLVDKLSFKRRTGYAALRSLLTTSDDVVRDDLKIAHIRLDSFLSEVSISPIHEKLLGKLEPRARIVRNGSIPKELQDVIGYDIAPAKLAEPRTWGWQVGQGLRTGANKFFYTELSSAEVDYDNLVVDGIFGKRIIPVSKKYSLPVLRYQKDAGGGLIISIAMLRHRLLYIQEDFYTSCGYLRDNDDAPLAEYIAVAEKTAIKSNGRLTYIPELSAVRPNIRVMETAEGLVRRHWFMLPTLTNRHRPQLCIARVNHKNARCLMIADEGVVVDANFSTLWMEKGGRQHVYAMFALMNSTWVQSYLEATSTVMGGGALKVEASHIRKLLIPLPTNDLRCTLSLLGKSLIEDGISQDIISKIDQRVLQSLLGNTDVRTTCTALQEYLKSKISMRER